MNASDRIYLDYAAATPVRPEVLAAMLPYFSEQFANPSAIHAEGRDARQAIDGARLSLARLLKIRTEEVTFTSGGTEANNLALLGVVEAALVTGRDARDIEIISTAIEHPSILETLSALEARGIVVHRVPVDRDGRIDMGVFETMLSQKTLLVTCAYVNSEVGVIQDVRRIVRTIRNIRSKACSKTSHMRGRNMLAAYFSEREPEAYIQYDEVRKRGALSQDLASGFCETESKQKSRKVYRTGTVSSDEGNKADEGLGTCFVHLDASQASLWLPCAMDTLGVDLLTLDAGKCYGPKGVGILAHKRYVPLRSHLFGGGQESGLRPGTENVPLIVGCAKALELAQMSYTERAARVAALRDVFFDELQRGIPGVLINGSRTHRVANNCNISIPGIDGEFAVVTLDTHGISASTRSACAGGKNGGSHVVAAITGDQDRANSTIRFTLGEETTREDLTYAAAVLSEHVRAAKMAL